MERITLTSLLLTAVVSSSPRQYHFVNQEMTWTEAQKYCRENYTDLVTINDVQEQNDIIQLLNSNSVCVWIGLRSTETWIWSLSDPDFYRADESQFRNWKPAQSGQSGQKSQPGGDGDCVYMEDDRKWHDITCGALKYFTCYNASSKGFIHIQVEKNWTDAQKYCRENHTDLASVRNETENEQIQIITGSEDSHKPWIGLHRLWVWSDNSTATFTHWKTDRQETSNHDDCALIDHHGQWTDVLCSKQHPFVCYDDNLVLIRENKTWTEALRYCRNISMDLVSVDSDQMQRWVKILFMKASASSDHVWLGLRHSCTVGLWFWVKGYTMCYDQWASDYDIGLDDCDKTVRSGAIRTKDNYWISRPETEEYNFICIK